MKAQQCSAWQEGLCNDIQALWVARHLLCRMAVFKNLANAAQVIKPASVQASCSCLLL